MSAPASDDRRETASFKIADQKINNLLRRLRDKNVCPCCTARALTYHGVCAAAQHSGSAEAIEMLEEIIGVLRERNILAPEPFPSTETH